MRRYPRLLAVLLLAAVLLSCNMPLAVVTPTPPGLTPTAPVQPATALPTPIPANTQPVPPTPQPTDAPQPTALPNPAAFAGLHTPVPGTWPPAASDPSATITYITQPGDTRAALARRFDLPESELAYLPAGLLPTGTRLQLRSTRGALLYADALLPDSEVIYSPSAAGFNIAAYIAGAGGYLSTYTETVNDETLSGAQIVERVALETSTNPRLLLAVLEYRTGWVFGPPGSVDPAYPIGFLAPRMEGLLNELSLVTRMLTYGYYGWRDTSRLFITYRQGENVLLAPNINAGTAALLNLFSSLYSRAEMEAALYRPDSFLDLYTRMFGDPWARAAYVEPLFADGLQAPALELPYAPGSAWHLTAGPHIAWGYGSPRSALDFAPPAPDGLRCTASSAWVTASAPGLVVRSERGQVLVDLDGDGYEQTGWVVLYMHIAADGRVPVGTLLAVNDPIGHASCEGGKATGTHVHIARKYNGEWIPASGMLPFTLSGWLVGTGAPPYQGSLTRNNIIIDANINGTSSNLVVR